MELEGKPKIVLNCEFWTEERWRRDIVLLNTTESERQLIDAATPADSSITAK